MELLLVSSNAQSQNQDLALSGDSSFLRHGDDVFPSNTPVSLGSWCRHPPGSFKRERHALPSEASAEAPAMPATA